MCECPLPHIRLRENRHTTFYLPQALGYIHCFNLLLYCCDETLTKSNVGKESASLAYTYSTVHHPMKPGQKCSRREQGESQAGLLAQACSATFFVVGSEFHLIKDNHDKLIHYNTYCIDE